MGLSIRRTILALFGVLILIGPGNWAGGVYSLDHPFESAGATVGGAREDTTHEEWPPAAWLEGEISDLSLFEQVMVLAGIAPGDPGEKEIKEQLERLETLPPVYEEVAEATLAGMTQALWHQWAALTQLPVEDQKRILAAVHGETDQEGLDSALARFDMAHSVKAAAVLMKTAKKVEKILETDSRDPLNPGATKALTEQLGIQLESVESVQAPEVPLHELAAGLSGFPLDAQATKSIQDTFAQAPAEGAQAIHRILAALDIVHTSATEDQDKALLALAKTIDEEYETLRIWSAMSQVRAYVERAPKEPPIRFPDVNADRPPLRIGLPWEEWDRTVPAPDVPELSEALAELARTFGDTATATNAHDLVAPLKAAMSEEEQHALARVLVAVASYIQTQRIGAHTPLPEPLKEEPALLLAWSNDLHEGRLPDPASDEARALFEVIQWLDVQRRADEALEELLAAAEEIVPAFTVPTSSPAPSVPLQGHDDSPVDELLPDDSPTPDVLDDVLEELDGQRGTIEDEAHQQLGQVHEELGDQMDQIEQEIEPHRQEACEEDPGLGKFMLLPYLTLDLCGTDTVWQEDEQAMVSIDVGGDDLYEHAAGTPFLGEFKVPTGVDIENTTVEESDLDEEVPVSLIFDLGGNDTFDAGDSDCAQGGACWGTSVLVAWTGDGVHERNKFIAGDQSQGFGLSRGTSEQAVYGILVERAGTDSSLNSTYRAGDRSQGAVLHETGVGAAGTLVRMVADRSMSNAVFEAGNWSQGVANGREEILDQVPSLGSFINALGADATGDHVYRAGKVAQGAVPSGPSPVYLFFTNFNSFLWTPPAIGTFASIAGPGANSTDAYHAVDQARGWGKIPDETWGPDETEFRHHYPSAFFIDALASQSLSPEEVLLRDEGKVGLHPSLHGSKHGNYSFLEHGHGWGQGRFIEIGGVDNYDPAHDGEGVGAGLAASMDLPSTDSLVPIIEDPGLLDDEGTSMGFFTNGGPAPRNDAVWAQPVEQGIFAGDPVDLSQILTDHVNWTGIDIDNMDRDSDMVPAFLAHAWSDWIELWEADPDDASRGPLPLTPCALIDLNFSRLDLDHPCGFVFTTGGNDRFGPGFVSPLMINLGGNDIYQGRIGAATGASTDLSLGLPLADSGSTTGPGTPVGISFLLDLGGNDVYHSPWNRNLGYGEDGGTGILFDLGGNDWFAAPDHTQGVGADGGRGVLVATQTPEVSETNRFLAYGPPAHGEGVRGGTGLLLSTADDNRLAGSSEGFNETIVLEEDDEGTFTGGSGVSSAARGTNDPPDLQELSMLDDNVGEHQGEILLEPARPYTFQARGSDDDKDPLRFCWRIDHGGGIHDECSTWIENLDGTVTHQIKYEWTNIRSTPGQETQAYLVEVTVEDPFGEVDSQAITVNLSTDPIGLLANELRGPRTVDLFDSPMETAYQVPVNALDVDRIEKVFVDWGDGSSDAKPWQEIEQAVDWAYKGWGADIQTLGRAEFIDGDLTVCVDENQTPLERAIDGETGDDNKVVFAYGFDPGPGRGNCAPVQAIVEFPGTRQISKVEVVLEVEDAGAGFIVEGILPTGSNRVLGTMEAREGEGIVKEMFPAELEDFDGIVVRQVLPEGRIPDEFEVVYLHEVNAWGPGMKRAWNVGGSFDLTYGYRSSFGAVSAIEDTIQVAQDIERFLGYQDFASRGPVHQASVASGTTYRLERTIDQPEWLDICVDWGDGTETCEGEAVESPEGTDEPEAERYAHRWSQEGRYNVSMVATVPGGARVAFSLLTVDVLEAWDLRVGTDPLVFLELAEENDVPTWYSGVPYYAIVDRSGDDRYIGQVAAPRPPWDAGDDPLAQMIRPGFLYDHEGNDVYISQEKGAQGFGHFGGVALLYDRTGNDVYIAPGHAQGAAWRHGIGILVDLDGDDTYNPVPPSHPDVHSGLPITRDPWESPPGTLAGTDNTRRGALWVQEAERASLVQGAAVDGMGLLVDQGGVNLFHAGDKGQGYASRELEDWRKYVTTDPDCDFFASPTFDPSSGADPNQSGVLCRFGITQWSVEEDEGSGMPTLQTNTTLFERFVTEGERLGPGLGALLTGDGVSAYKGGSYVQGVGLPGARGILLDQGASVATADLHAQGFATSQKHMPVREDISQAHAVTGGEPVEAEIGVGGTGAIVSQGPFTWRASSEAQGTTSQPTDIVNEPPLALAAGFGAGDAQCRSSPCRQMFHHVGVPFGIPPPDTQWAGATPGEQEVVTDAKIELAAEVSRMSSLVDGVTLETAVMVIPRAVDTSGLQPDCGWPVIGPPVIVQAKEAVTLGTATTFEATLDLEKRLSDGPLIPSGCLELRFYAREHFPGGATSAWASAQRSIMAVPAPDMTPTKDRLIVQPLEETELEARLDQPWAAEIHASQDPVLEWSVTEPLGSGENLQSACNAGAQLEPPHRKPRQEDDNTVFSTFNTTWTAGEEDGEYIVCTRGKWDVQGTGFSAWKKLTRVTVDSQKPIVTAEPAREHWPDPRINPLRVRGNVTSGISGLAETDSIQVRLVQGETIWSLVESVDVHADGLEESEWEVSIGIPSDRQAFRGGNVTIQVNATSGAGVRTGWQDAGGVTFDLEAPQVIDGWKQSTGTNATRMEPEVGKDFVILTVRIDDLACDRDRDDCMFGAGVDPESVTGILHGSRINIPPEVLRVATDEQAVGIDASRCKDKQTHCVHLAWRIDPGQVETIPEDIHYLAIHAKDNVGNTMSHNPGLEFVIDRTPPQLGDPVMGLPQDQTAVKPEDELLLSITARDPLPPGGKPASGLFRFVVDIGGDETTFPDPNDPDDTLDDYRTGDLLYELPVPIGDHGDGEKTLEVTVTGIDRALNEATREAGTLDYRGTPPLFQDFANVTRADELRFTWTSDRHVKMVLAESWTAEDPDDVVKADVTSDGIRHEARFVGLDPDTHHTIRLMMGEEAGWLVEEVLDVTTLPLLMGKILLDDEPEGTRSGIVDVEGEIIMQLNDLTSPHLDVLVSLHVGEVDLGAPEDEKTLRLTPDSSSASFGFQWDTRSWPSGVHELVVVMDDLTTFRMDNWTVTTDNEPPELWFETSGAEARNGWYNGTVLLNVLAEDKTAPVLIETMVNGEKQNASEGLEISMDGVYGIQARAEDAAVPPNVAEDSLRLKVDRTPPVVQAAFDMDHPAVSVLEVPLVIEAHDNLSGVEAYRVGTNESTLKWLAQPPGNVLLPDGSDGTRWVHVDVRDHAGNIRHKSMPVTLDREPPQLVMAWWAGVSAQGEPMLEFVARDTLDGTGRPSGVADVRFADFETPGEWSPWSTANETMVAMVPEGFWSKSGTLIQLRDRAGNVADAVASPPIPHQWPEQDPGDRPHTGQRGSPPEGLLHVAGDKPQRVAHVGEQLSFVVYVRAWDGDYPDSVWLVIGDNRIPMVPDEEAEADGSWVYRAGITATRTHIGKGVDHYHFAADYGGQEVRTESWQMPVTGLLESPDGQVDQQGENAKSVPLPGTVLFLFVLLAVFLMGKNHGPSRRGSP